MKSPSRLLSALVMVCGTAFAAPLTVQLHTSVPSPQPVGVSIHLATSTENKSEGKHAFRYAISTNGGPFRTIRDFSQSPSFVWTPQLQEHTARIQITARNNSTKEMASAEMNFQIVSRTSGKNALVTPSSHPLIALFSAPPCPQGGTFRVAFHAEGEQATTRTPAQPCLGSISNNVWVSGMRADTTYQLRAEWTNNAKMTPGSWIPFHTGMTDGQTVPVSVLVSRADAATAPAPVWLYGANNIPFATDLLGRTIWYLRESLFMSRFLPGGRILGFSDGSNSNNTTKRNQLLRELDLAGNTLRETNTSRVAEQLESWGIKSDCRDGGKECVSGFHHEAIRLPNGHTLVVAGLERMMPAGTQGSKEAVDILGDIVVDLDEDFQVTAMWNEFDHLDVTRKSYKDAKCKGGEGGGGCPPVLLAKEAHGWTHTNSLNYIPSSGDFLVSIPEQEWIVKVDWKNGKGSGRILWHLGNGGDFKAVSNDPSPWFSYAHDIGFEPEGSNLLAVLDNSHIRFQKDKKANSRAQIWKLDEQNMTATLFYNADLGGHAGCCGSIQQLKGGSYASLTGSISGTGVPRGLAIETDQQGKTISAMKLEGSGVYRSFRLDDMYSAPIR